MEKVSIDNGWEVRLGRVLGITEEYVDKFV